MIPRLLFCLLAGIGPIGGMASAHSKSISFSDWQWAGKSLSVNFTTTARDVTLLPEIEQANNLSDALAAHVTKHMRLVQINTPCRLRTPFRRG